MKLYIVNKNKVGETYALSDLQAFNLDEGFVMTDNYNETLDSVDCRISHLENEIEIEPLDFAVLEDTHGNYYYYVVNNYNCIMEGRDPIIYQYSISLVSETKLLEGIILPNLSITQLKENKRSVWYYLNQYLNEYCPLIHRVDSPDETKFKFGDGINSQNVQARFENIECPEFQWNMPTLREVITDLMMVDDCIPRMRNSVIGYIDLTETKNEITNYNYISKSQSSEDYASDIRMQLQNVLNNEIDGVYNSTLTTEYITFEPENEYATVVNSNNIVLKTQYPILNVKHLYILIPVKSGDTYTFTKYDLCSINGHNFVKERYEYQTLPVKYRISDYISITWDELSEYQNIMVYYTRGGNIINGFSNINKGFWTVELATWYIWLARLYYSSLSRTAINTYFTPIFQIEYETMQEAVVSIGKSKKGVNFKEIIDHQTNSWVNINNQAKLEYQKADRIGNPQIMLNQRWEDDVSFEPIKVGDTYGDYVVHKVEYVWYEHHIEVNAYATEKYILQNYYTGIKSKVRTWRNATDEALQRHDLVKYYCEFSKTNKTNVLSYSSYFLTPITNDLTVNNPITYAFLRTVDANGTQYPTAEGSNDPLPQSSALNKYYYSLNVVSRLVDKSMIFTCGANNNTFVGKIVDYDLIDKLSDYEETTIVNGEVRLMRITDSETEDYGGVPMQFLPYVDGNYEFASYTLSLYSKDKNTFGRTFEGANNFNITRANLAEAGTRPRVFDTDEDYKISYSKDLHKDNREITFITTQFEFCSDTDDIRVYSDFVKMQEAIRTESLTSRKIHKRNESGTYDNLGNVNVSVVGNKVTITFNTTYVYTLVIGDADNNSWLEIDMKTQTNVCEFYLNILSTRDDNEYYSDRRTKQ